MAKRKRLLVDYVGYIAYSKARRSEWNPKIEAYCYREFSKHCFDCDNHKLPMKDCCLIGEDLTDDQIKEILDAVGSEYEFYDGEEIML